MDLGDLPTSDLRGTETPPRDEGTAEATARSARIATLLLKVASEDRQAFEQLYDLLAPRFYAVTRRVLGRGAEADEALQDTFLKIWSHADQWPGKGSAEAWLLVIARHAAIDRRRAEHQRSRHAARDHGDDSLRPLPATPEEASALRSDANQLRDCLDELPAERADVIRSAYFSGMTYAEMAEETGRPEGTLKSWVHRSLGLLRSCLEGRGVEGSS